MWSNNLYYVTAVKWHQDFFILDGDSFRPKGVAYLVIESWCTYVKDLRCRRMVSSRYVTALCPLISRCRCLEMNRSIHSSRWCKDVKKCFHTYTHEEHHTTLCWTLSYEKPMKCQVYSSPRKYSNCKRNRTDQIMWTLQVRSELRHVSRNALTGFMLTCFFTIYMVSTSTRTDSIFSWNCLP